jgi:hypothetical protein
MITISNFEKHKNIIYQWLAILLLGGLLAWAKTQVDELKTEKHELEKALEKSNERQLEFLMKLNEVKKDTLK